MLPQEITAYVCSATGVLHKSHELMLEPAYTVQDVLDFLK